MLKKRLISTTFKCLQNVRILPKCHMHIFDVSKTNVQSLENVKLKVWQDLLHKVGTVYSSIRNPNPNPNHKPNPNPKPNQITPFKIIKHPQRYVVYYTWPEKNDQVQLHIHVFEKCLNTSRKSHAHLQCKASKNVRTFIKTSHAHLQLSITTRQGLKKDYTKKVPYTKTPARCSPFYKRDALCATQPKIHNQSDH
jgi:hypothetical protein